MSAALTYIRPEDIDIEIEWDAINAARWTLVEHIRPPETEDVFIYESPGFDGELTIIFADDHAARKQNWQRIARAIFTDADGERVWYWPNG